MPDKVTACKLECKVGTVRGKSACVSCLRPTVWVRRWGFLTLWERERALEILNEDYGWTTLTELKYENRKK